MQEIWSHRAPYESQEPYTLMGWDKNQSLLLHPHQWRNRACFVRWFHQVATLDKVSRKPSSIEQSKQTFLKPEQQDGKGRNCFHLYVTKMALKARDCPLAISILVYGVKLLRIFMEQYFHLYVLDTRPAGTGVQNCNPFLQDWFKVPQIISASKKTPHTTIKLWFPAGRIKPKVAWY